MFNGFLGVLVASRCLKMIKISFFYELRKPCSRVLSANFLHYYNGFKILFPFSAFGLLGPTWITAILYVKRKQGALSQCIPRNISRVYYFPFQLLGPTWTKRIKGKLGCFRQTFHIITMDSMSNISRIFFPFLLLDFWAQLVCWRILRKTQDAFSELSILQQCINSFHAILSSCYYLTNHFTTFSFRSVAGWM